MYWKTQVNLCQIKKWELFEKTNGIIEVVMCIKLKINKIDKNKYEIDEMMNINN